MRLNSAAFRNCPWAMWTKLLVKPQPGHGKPVVILNKHPSGSCVPKPTIEIGKCTFPSKEGCNTNDPTMAVAAKATIHNCSVSVMDSIRDGMTQEYDYARNCQG